MSIPLQQMDQICFELARFLQAVKAVCAKLGGVETLDLAEALDEFSKTCVKFDWAKGEPHVL